MPNAERRPSDFWSTSRRPPQPVYHQRSVGVIHDVPPQRTPPAALGFIDITCQPAEAPTNRYSRNFPGMVLVILDKTTVELHQGHQGQPTHHSLAPVCVGWGGGTRSQKP